MIRKLRKLTGSQVITGMHDVPSGDVSGLRGDVSGLWGEVFGLRGDVSGLWGEVFGLRGDVSEIWGDVTGIRGDASGLRGDVAGIRGDVSYISGDLDACQITDEERKAGIRIGDLIEERDEVMSTVIPPMPEIKNNHIVAVNSHEALLAAMTSALVKIIEHDKAPFQCESFKGASAIDDARQILEKAIAQAEGKV